jgi:hypothetical protein
MSLRRSRGCVLWISLAGACSSQSATTTPQQHDARRDAGARHGFANAERGESGPIGSGDAALPCTPTLDSKSEFFVACADSGAAPSSKHPALDAGASGRHEAGVHPDDAALNDSAEPQTSRDGSAAPDAAEVSVPDARIPQDSGCPSAAHSCAQASIESKPADVVCTLHGDVVRVAAHVCETCGTAGRLLQFWVMANVCGTCADGTSKGYPGDYWFEANSCRDFELDLELASLTSSNNPCIDVYPRFDNAGDDLITDISYKIHTCRCDLERQTCVQCVDGLCDAPP